MTNRLRCGVLAIIAVLTLWTEVSAAPVPFNGHTYELILTNNINWTNAKNAAAVAGGYLVTITSAQENQFLVTTFDALFDNFVWIGASDSAAEGASETNWEWVVGPDAGLQFWQADPPEPATGREGVPIAGRFANWGAAEPDNFNDEDAAALNLGPLSLGGTANGQWGDTDLGTLLDGYIIERDLPVVAGVPEPSATIALLLGASLAAWRVRGCRARGQK
jgi:hypothetical protein